MIEMSKEMGDQKEEPTPKPPKKDPGPPKKKKKKRDLRDESVDRDLKGDEIGAILDSGENETTEQASKKYRQKGGQ